MSHFLCAKHYFELFLHVNLLNPTASYILGTIIIPPFPDEKTEAERLRNLSKCQKRDSNLCGLAPASVVITTVLCLI